MDEQGAGGLAKLRICYIGDGRYIHGRRSIAFSRSEGHEVHFVSYVPLSEDETAFLEGTTVFHGVLPPFIPKKPWDVIKATWWLRRVLSTSHIDLVNCEFLSTNAWYTALTLFHPFLITVTGGGDVDYPVWRPDRAVQRFFAALALRQADGVVSWSEALASVVRPRLRPGVEARVVHGGVDTDMFQPGPPDPSVREKIEIPPHAPIVFSPRIMRRLSNIVPIAESVPIVLRRIPDAYFVFASPEAGLEPEYLETVQGVLESNGCRSRCRFVGQLSHAEIAAYYQASDVVVSIAETDGTPMSVLEALATEVGVVVGDFAGYDPRYIEPEATVLAASPSDVPALAGTIIRLLEQPDLRGRLGSEGRRRVLRDGTYVTQMKLLHTFYQVLVAKGRRRGRWRWAMVARARQRRAR